jgi:hypothetical protein
MIDDVHPRAREMQKEEPRDPPKEDENGSADQSHFHTS